MKKTFRIIISALLLLMAGAPAVFADEAAHEAVNEALPLWSIIPFAGMLLASWIGTTGAAMLLIRPVIRANEWREKKAHIIIFFIFLVANMGGCLTPLGDPPLFMGFQRNVPFFWTTTHLLPILLFNMVIMLAVFFLMDRVFYKKELAAGRSPQDILKSSEKEKIAVEGGHNLIFIVMIVVAVILSGIINKQTGGAGWVVYDDCVFSWGSITECVIIMIAALCSLLTTKKSTRQLNEFTYAPIAEVAKLFIGIFITMIPALAILKVHGADLGFDTPLELFWSTGILSSFLDNTPTYLVFLQVAGALGQTTGVATTVGMVGVKMLEAISAGAVFMGAVTYIGNAPNFMVKSIAEENKIKMPSFFGYIIKWSLPILIPLFILDSLVFFVFV